MMHKPNLIYPLVQQANIHKIESEYFEGIQMGGGIKLKK